MSKPVLNRAAHFSIVWGITLAVITLVEWNNVERDPLAHEILSPFIDRQVTVSLEREQDLAETGVPAAIDPDAADPALRYDVSLGFNGPLFLACFFIPVLIFHGLGTLWRRIRGG